MIVGTFGRAYANEPFGVIYSCMDGFAKSDVEQFAKCFEHSEDGGKTWHPCGILE